MAKGKRKRKNKKRKGGTAAWAAGAPFWGKLLRETLGNFAGQLMADGTEQMAKGQNGAAAADDEKAEEQDVAADVLRVLSEAGPKSIAELIVDTGASLTPLLRALEQTREFRLIELVDDEQVVQLTPCGSRTASALRREQIRSDGMKMLEG